MIRPSPVALLLAVCLILALQGLTGAPESEASERPVPTVAVLYFQDLGPSPELAPLRKALAQMLITDLSRLEGLRVVQREQVESFVAETAIGEEGLTSADTAVLAGRAMQADYVIQGTLSGTSQRLTVQVTVTTDKVLQAPLGASLSRPPEEFMQLEQEVCGAIIEALGVGPTLRSVEPSPLGAASPGLAVMDFENLSTSGELDPLQGPLSDMFCAALSQIPQVKLVERARVKEVIQELGLAATGLVDHKTAAKLGQMLGAQRMLISSFLEMGGTLRFDSHLLDTETGQLVAALTVSGAKDDYAILIARLARQVAAALSVPVPAREEPVVTRGSYGMSWEVYTYYKKALDDSGRQHELALEELSRCLYLAPDNEEIMTTWLCMSPGGRWADTTMDICERVIALYSNNPEKVYMVERAYEGVFLTYLEDHQPEKAVGALDRALAGDLPADSKMVLLMDKANAMGWVAGPSEEETLAVYRQILDYPDRKVAPIFAAAQEMARILYGAGRADEAVSAMLEAEDAPPNSRFPGGAGNITMVDTLFEYSLQKGDLPSARRLVKIIMQQCPEAAACQGWDLLKQAELYEAEGKLGEAIQSYGQVAELRLSPSFFDAVRKIGDLCLKEGRVPEAIAAYQRLLRCTGCRADTGDQLARQVSEIAGRPVDLGVPVPATPGYNPHSILLQEDGCHATIILGDHGYLIDSLYGLTINDPSQLLPVVNPSEMLCRYQTVAIQWPKGGEPWWVTQSWLNFLRRGGGVFLCMPGYVDLAEAGPVRDSLGVGRPSGEELGGTGWLMAKQRPSSVQGLTGLLVIMSTPLQCEEALVLAEDSRSGKPVLAAVERGLGRALVAGFGLSPMGRECMAYMMMEDDKYLANGKWKRQPTADIFLLSAFGWLVQEQASGEKGELLARFHAVSDSWARLDYRQAQGLLRAISTDYAGTEYEELALYSIGDLLQNSMRDYGPARAQFEEVYRKFPQGELALPARLAAADCMEAALAESPSQGTASEDLLRRYAEVADLGAGSEIGATAELKIGFIHMLAGQLEEAIAAFRKVANDFPAGYAKSNALYALGYCYEKTGRTPDAERTYQSILDMSWRAEPPNPIDPQCFPAAWRLLIQGTKYAEHFDDPVHHDEVVTDGLVCRGYNLQDLARTRLDQLRGGTAAAQ